MICFWIGWGRFGLFSETELPGWIGDVGISQIKFHRYGILYKYHFKARQNLIFFKEFENQIIRYT